LSGVCRKTFVTNTIGGRRGAGAAPGSHEAAAIDRRRIVDARAIWEAETLGWKWVPWPAVPQLTGETFTIERLVPMMDEPGGVARVIVPAVWPADRNDYALETVLKRTQPLPRMRAYHCRTQVRRAAAERAGAEAWGAWRDFNNAQNITWLTDRHRRRGSWALQARLRSSWLPVTAAPLNACGLHALPRISSF